MIKFIYWLLVGFILTASKELLGFENTVIIALAFAYCEYRFVEPDKPKLDVMLVFEGLAMSYDYNNRLPLPQKYERIWVDVWRQGYVYQVEHIRVGESMVIKIHCQIEKPIFI